MMNSIPVRVWRLALEDKFEVFLAANPEEAFNVMESEPLEVVLTDLKWAVNQE